MTMTGHDEEGLKQAAILAREHSQDCRGYHVLALALSHEQRVDDAIEEIRRVMEMAPGYNPGWDTLAALLVAQGHSEATIDLNRQALGLAPFSADLHVALGSAMLFNGRESEASDQLEYAWRLNPDSADMLANVAWRLATRADAAQENGRVAVKLAEQACAWTQYQKPIQVGTLAAAYAQAGRYEEAVKTAERVRALAVATGQADLTAKAQELIDLFRSGRPYRETRGK
jgi:tetratricopeptide (TPR) repeat protein